MKEFKFKLSLFNKLLIAIVVIVVVFGAINITIVRNSVHNSLDAEIEKRSIIISKAISEQALPNILAGNISALNSLINNVIDIDPSIYYIFILDENNEVIAHSFENAVPTNLINANAIYDNNTYSTKLIVDENDKENIIKDFAMVVLDKRIGVVRLGVLETQIKSTVTDTVNKLLIMIIFFLILGVIGAWFFSYIIAKPLKLLSQQSDVINIDNLKDNIEQISSFRGRYFFRLRKLFYTDDEIDVLYDKFLLMLKRIEENHNAMTQLQISVIQTEKLASVGTLSAGIAHEINNPIAGIKNCLKRISDSPDNIAQNIRYIDLMNDALRKMENVIRQLLDFSKKDKADFSPISLKPFFL